MDAKIDTSMTAWRQWQDSPWGRLRYTLAEHNLARHLGDAPLRVLDLAGGDGSDAVRLAVRGHDVTVLDNSPAMLAAAAERAAAAGVAITRIEADIADLPDAAYDVVLCHNIIQYRDDALALALDALRPGGLLSVMAINRHAAPLVTAVRRLDPAAALAALDTDQARTATFDTTITLYTAEDLSRLMRVSGCRVLAHYGIRAVCDYIADDERKHDPAFYADLERLELALTDREPHKHTARLFQLVGRKDVP
ncbi:class I SAM-dependent methyltransferase [Saccharothrix sp. NPDC042600]|uniref:class I SAM-dependent methyltransferase n=1 Tax=Saccharothrix TaxID=2071 RepID=UPI0033D0459E